MGTVAFRSWSSMKSWVMIWLWYLNALYWVAFFYLEQPEARWALLAYLFIGPIGMLLVRSQRGLTRLAGLMHLPWLFYLIYLGLRLFTGVLGEVAFEAVDAFYWYWLQAIFWSTLACVVLDIWDVVRWVRGERYVLGTAKAAAVGASKLAKQS
jgi:hypothetical protein